MTSQYQRVRSMAFTVVELLVIVAVISILVTITVFAWGNWQQSSAENEVSSDLVQAANAMNTERNFNNSYPATTLPSSFKPSNGVTITIHSSSNSPASFCLNGTSTTNSSVQMHIRSTNPSTAQEGSCS